MGWTFFWAICLAGGLWGSLVVFSEHVEKNMCDPIYNRIADGGRKTILQFLIYSTLFSCLLRLISRAPLWIAAYYIVQYVGYTSDAALKFCAACVFAVGFSRAAELVRDFYPPTKEHDTFTKYMHRR